MIFLSYTRSKMQPSELAVPVLTQMKCRSALLKIWTIWELCDKVNDHDNLDDILWTIFSV
jgi:hypothetical protein